MSRTTQDWRRRLLKGLEVASRVAAVATQGQGVRRLVRNQPRSIAAATLVEGLQRELGCSPTLIIDGGANIGQFARAATDGFPGAEVHSFEPVSDVFAQLQHNLSGAQNVRLNRLGLGARVEQRMIHVNAHRHSSSLLDTVEGGGAVYGDLRTERDEQIDVTTLDDYLDGIEKRGPWLLKLDVQGFEEPVLRGAKENLSKFDAVLLEVGIRPTYAGETLFADLLELMRDEGFDLDGVLDVGRDDEHRIVQMDALFKPRLHGR